MSDRIAELEAKVERLREALRNAVAWAEAYDPDWVWVEEARRLLEEKP